MTTYILGAGPAGMATADGLIDAKDGNFIVLEQGSSLGGLAQTLEWKGIGSHDLGPHKIFSLDRELVSRVENLLPDADWLTRDKVSSIYMKGHYLPYPPSPFSLSGVFGLPAFINMVTGYGIARLKSLFIVNDPHTYAEDLIGRVGVPLYNILFKPITEKLWGDPHVLDVKLSRGRVQTPSLVEILGRLLKLKKESDFEALKFRYPKGGLGRLWKAIEAKARNGAGQFLLEHAVTRLTVADGHVRAIHYRAKTGEGTFPVGEDDFVVSTLPLALTTDMLFEALPTHFPQLAREVVRLNDLLLVFLHVDRPSLINEAWIFIPDQEIIFHRVSEQESFDLGMTPNGSIVCCEIMSSESRLLATRSDDELCQEATQGLHDMGYSGFKILDQRVIRLPKSYPVFRTGYEQGLSEIVQKLDGFKNFRSVGRQGAFNYIGTLDAMDIGYGMANWLVSGKRQSWQQERERTNHYPVLD